jgi:NAD(P)-dependent dehydrogenase (short-subunit alcohol dehydrogenase family)
LKGTGIARVLSSPEHANFAVALLARSAENLESVKKTIKKSNPESCIETFTTDTSPENISRAFSEIAKHQSFTGLKLRAAVYSIKHSSKKPFLEETHAEFTRSLDEYVGGAMAFAQETVKRLFTDHGKEPLSSGAGKKGTLIFTGTLGALRTNPEYSAYGAGRAGVRMLAQGLAKEYSAQGIHVVHAIANGRIADKDDDEQKTGLHMSADAVGLEYLHLINQKPALWTHELDMRPAQEKF